MTRTIASIYPLEQKAERPLYSGFYALPAVKKGDPPFLLRLEDKVQHGHKLFIEGGGPTKETIPGEQIAPDILREFSENAPGMTQDCGPGIWLVRETVDENEEYIAEDGLKRLRVVSRPASEAEKAAMFAQDHQRAKDRQAAWFEYQIAEGDRMPEFARRTPLMKLSCQYMGRNRKWLEEMKDGDVKLCPYCTRSIPVGAVRCPECHEIVDFEAYARLEAQKKAALAGTTAAEPEAAVVTNP